MKHVRRTADRATRLKLDDDAVRAGGGEGYDAGVCLHEAQRALGRPLWHPTGPSAPHRRQLKARCCPPPPVLRSRWPLPVPGGPRGGFVVAVVRAPCLLYGDVVGRGGFEPP